MRKKSSQILHLSASVLLPLIVLASPASAATVAVNHSGDDITGKRLAYEVREKIAASNRHSLVERYTDAGFSIVIVTIGDGERTVYSASLLLNAIDKEGFDSFVTSWVGECGSNRVENCAAGLVSGADDHMSEIAAAFQDALQQQP